MADIYRNGGVWYAPRWKSPVTGEVFKAHSLATADREEADARWVLERARALRPVEAAETPPAPPIILPDVPTPAPAPLKLSEAIDTYLCRVQHAIAARTLGAYEGHAVAVLVELGDYDVEALAGAAGTVVLEEYARAEVTRLEGRTHTVVKRFESIIKPTLRLAHHRGELSRLPLFPRLRSDYRAAGRRKHFLTREAFAALRAELPEEDTIHRKAGGRLRVFPRGWADIEVSTGMHDSDAGRFRRRDFDPARGIWRRRNTKGDGHYAAEWLPADALLAEACARLIALRPRFSPDALFVADVEVPGAPDPDPTAPPGTPPQWMRQRLEWATKRAGLGVTPQPIDFRHTCAVWRREEGWEFEDVARLLANSTGMVREVYSDAGVAHFENLVNLGAARVARAIDLARAADAAITARKGPRKSQVSTPTIAPVAITVAKSPKEGS